jgi:hypothetical protein
MCLREWKAIPFQRLKRTFEEKEEEEEEGNKKT